MKIFGNFWKWIGKSKMVDKNNKPIVLYHGSNNSKRFSTFNDSTPIWFTSYKGYAEAFTYISNIDFIANDNRINYLSELTNIDTTILKEILKESNGDNLFNITNSETFKKLVKDKGYDGLETKEGGNLTTFAVFDANQIKSTTNNGKYCIDNKNIYS